MQEMMNDTAELITEANNGDDLPVVPYEEVQPEEQEKSELDKLKEELLAVTYDDILNSTAPYEKILTLPDEFAVSQYKRRNIRTYTLTHFFSYYRYGKHHSYFFFFDDENFGQVYSCV